MQKTSFALLVAALQLASASALAATPPVADAIWFNGPIITIDDQHPKAQAVAVKDGKILAVGDRQHVFEVALLHRPAADPMVKELARVLSRVLAQDTQG